MLRRLAPAGLTVLGLVALVLAMPSFSGASAQTVKPKYRVSVRITGTFSHIVAEQPYNYTLTVKNTGRKVLKKYQVRFAPAQLMTSSSPTLKLLPTKDLSEQRRAARTFTNLRAGSTRRITVALVYPVCTDSRCMKGLSLSAQGIGNSAFANKVKGVIWYP